MFREEEPKFTICHAEVPIHEPFGERDSSLYYDNLRGTKGTDSYIGAPASTFKPHFTYHDVRYVEVEGFYKEKKFK